MDRNFYFIGIAFFGMVNGLFNQTWLLFAILNMQILAPSLLFGSVSLTLMFASLMVSTATVILGGIPAALYERFSGLKEDLNEPRCGSGLRGRRSSPSPVGNFFAIRLVITVPCGRSRGAENASMLGRWRIGAGRATASCLPRQRGLEWSTCNASRSRSCCAPAASARSPSSA